MTRLLFLSGLAGISMIVGGLLPLRRKRWPQQALLRFMAFGSGVLLGLSAGSFVYIGASDILPRLHEERSLPVFFLLVLGVAVTWVARA